MKTSAGRIVHFVLPEGSPRRGEHRAAIITSNWDGSNVNLMVLLDQDNDLVEHIVNFSRCGPMQARVWSATLDESGKPGTWHWPERVE